MLKKRREWQISNIILAEAELEDCGLDIHEDSSYIENAGCQDSSVFDLFSLSSLWMSGNKAMNEEY